MNSFYSIVLFIIVAARTKIIEESAKQNDSKKNLKAQLFITKPEE